MTLRGHVPVQEDAPQTLGLVVLCVRSGARPDPADGPRFRAGRAEELRHAVERGSGPRGGGP